jgi:hypothetical protein
MIGDWERFVVYFFVEILFVGIEGTSFRSDR